MKTATYIKTMETVRPEVTHRLYKVDPPMEGEKLLDGEYTPTLYEYVIVSAAAGMFSGPETYIFGADEDGTVQNWLELEGSFRGGLNHEKALENAGYTVVYKEVSNG